MEGNFVKCFSSPTEHALLETSQQLLSRFQTARTNRALFHNVYNLNVVVFFAQVSVPHWVSKNPLESVYSEATKNYVPTRTDWQTSPTLYLWCMASDKWWTIPQSSETPTLCGTMSHKSWPNIFRSFKWKPGNVRNFSPQSGAAHLGWTRAWCDTSLLVG